MASIGEANLIRMSRGLFPKLPGMNGPVNTRRMDEINSMMELLRDALIIQNDANSNERRQSPARMEAIMEIFRAVSSFLSDTRRRRETEPLIEEVLSVVQLVAVEVLEIRGSRAMRSILRV
jgi:hypothetical protein